MVVERCERLWKVLVGGRGRSLKVLEGCVLVVMEGCGRLHYGVV